MSHKSFSRTVPLIKPANITCYETIHTPQCPSKTFKEYFYDVQEVLYPVTFQASHNLQMWLTCITTSCDSLTRLSDCGIGMT